MIGNPVLHHTQQKIQQTVLILEGAFRFFVLWLRHSIAILFYTSELRSISETPVFANHLSLTSTNRFLLSAPHPNTSCPFHRYYNT